jgi:plastocyanin
VNVDWRPLPIAGQARVAALELLALPPVEMGTACGAEPVSARKVALYLKSRIYQMASSRWTTTTRLVFATLTFMLAPAMALATQDNPGIQRVDMDLGDYQFHPKIVSIAAGTAAELVLTNRDAITPHNFIVEAPEAGMEVNLEVSAGESATIVLRPTRPGTYTFYCDKKFLFFASHREKGMEGQIEVTAGSE